VKSKNPSARSNAKQRNQIQLNKPIKSTVGDPKSTEPPDADRKAAVLAQFVKFSAMIGALGGAGHPA
jgi:hypothetical protein